MVMSLVYYKNDAILLVAQSGASAFAQQGKVSLVGLSFPSSTSFGSGTYSISTTRVRCDLAISDPASSYSLATTIDSIPKR